MALTPRQLAVIRARARAKKAKPAAEMQRPTALGGLGYQPEEEASRQAFRQGAANVAVPSAGPQQPKAPTRLSAAAGQFAQSATLGQAPNILAAPYALTGQFPEAKAFYQQRLMQGAEKFPVTTGAADIAGFLAPGGAVLKGATTLARPVTRAVQTAPAIVRGVATVAGGAALGATEGALYGGTVQAERQAMEQGQAAPTMQQRGEAAIPAAGMGAVVGGALPIVGRALAPVGTAIAGQAVKAFGPGATARQAERVAQKAVRADLQRAGINNLDDFLKAAEQYQGKPVMTAELTQSMTNSLTALTRAKGTTGDKVQAILENRIQGFPERMMRDLQEATGLDPAAIVDNLDDLIQSRQALAAPQYEKALAQPFTMTPTLEVLMKDSPEAASAFKEVERILKTELAGTGKTLEDVPKLDVYDRVKKILDERVRRLREEGKTSQAKAISDFTQRLRNELDVIVPEKYKAARLIGGEAPSLRDANKAGIKAYRLPFDMFKKEFAKVKGADAEAFKGAFVREISNIIEKNPARASAILAPEFQSKLRLMFGKDAADRLTANVRNEIAMRTTGARFNPNVGAVSSQALMGVPSQQADEILAAGEATLEFAQNLLSGRWASAVGPVLNYFRRAGYTEAQLNAIGDLLASDPQRAARILFPNEMARLGATPGGAAATNVLANPTQPPSGGRNTLAMPPEVGGAFVGGALGATQGETPEERARNALLGAAGGALGGRMARGMTPDKTRMGSNLGNLGKANKPIEIPKSDADEMVKIFNETLTPATKRLEQFKDALGDKYTWQRVDLQELEDMFGKNNIPPQALQAVKDDGFAILHGTDINATWSKPSKAPTEEGFWADAAAEEGWIENRAETLDDIFSPDMASKPSATLAAAEAMLYLARKEGWKASEVRGGAGRYWQLSKEKPNGEEAVVSVRVSNHARQSTQYDPKDINLAPQVGANNSEYAADDFTSMMKKLRAAEAADEMSPSTSSNVLAPKPVQKAQATGYEGQDIGEAKEWVAARSKGLDMSQAGRMERAAQQGFKVDMPLYHGTASNFAAFDKAKFGKITQAKSAKLGVWMSSSPETASGYAKLAGEDNPVSVLLEQAEAAGRKGKHDEAFRLNTKAENLEIKILNEKVGINSAVMPLFARGNLKTIDMQGARYAANDIKLSQLAEQAKREGFDGLHLQNFSDEGVNRYNPTDHVLVFNPSNIRSTNAAFDPSSKQSANILAGVGAVGAGAAMTGAIRPPDQKKPPGQRPRG